MTIDYTKPNSRRRHHECIATAAKPAAGQAVSNGARIGCGVLILLGAAGVAALVVFVFGAIKSTTSTTKPSAARNRIRRSSPALGQPIEPGWWVTGSVNIHNDSGTAPRSRSRSTGPKVSATIHADAIEGRWWKFSGHVVEGGGPWDRLLREDRRSRNGGSREAHRSFCDLRSAIRDLFSAPSSRAIPAARSASSFENPLTTCSRALRATVFARARGSR